MKIILSLIISMITVLSFSQDLKNSKKELSKKEKEEIIAKKEITSKVIKKDVTTKRINEYPGVEWKKEIKKTKNLKKPSGVTLKPKQDNQVKSLKEYPDVKLKSLKKVEQPNKIKEYPGVEWKPSDKKKEAKKN